MQIKLLINLNILRPALTGIGYYTKNIIKECLKRNIELVGIKNGKLLDQQEIKELITSLEDISGVSPGSSLSFKQRSVELLRSFPGIYAIKYYLISVRAKKILNSLAEQGFIYFEPSFVPMQYKGKIITTIHDLSFITHPEFHPVERVNFLTKMVKQSVAVSNHIVVDSNFIRSELMENYSIKESQLSTVYLGVEDKFRVYDQQEVAPILNKLNLKQNRFILSVATLEPRKNLAKLVESYRELSDELKVKYPLVLVGSSGWKNSALFDSIQDLIENGNIIVTGYLSDIELNHIYSSAALFVYPSIYEGFGLPIIEAMASGTAVITSNCGATAEVAGDFAFLVDPTNKKAISEGIESILSDPNLRLSLEEKAISRASSFTWGKCVDDLLSIAQKL
ncbi:glycosyltransferase family 4 protein [Psychromonas sp. KJ10-10]|uniref:glycosyltransferase family 4 protein n=1 Tax=Psychromonas sp. KJ10-10 TaxID=3391823 RepID=UPI0039B4538C